MSVSGIEYDAVVLAEDGESRLLTLIESKAAAPQQAESLSPSIRGSHSPAQAIEVTRLNKYFRPIQAAIASLPENTLTGTSFLLVLPQDTFNPEIYLSQKTLMEKYGGKIAAVPINTQDLRDEVYNRLPKKPQRQ